MAAFILNQAIINQPENQRGGEEKYRFMADAFHFAVADQPSESLKDRAAGWIAAAPNVAADGIHGVRDWVSTKAMVNIATEFTEPGAMRDLMESSVGKETMEKVLSGVNKTIIEANGVTPYLPLPAIRARPSASVEAAAQTAPQNHSRR